MFIINKILRILTFFGTVFRATYEQKICKKTGLMIESVKYFESGSNCGHVMHELPKTKKSARKLCLKPLILGFFLGLIILIPASLSLFFLENFKIIVFVSYWIGISLWANIFPSPINAHMFKTFAKKEGKPFDKFLSFIFGAGSRLESTGISLLTSILASFILAQMLWLLLPFLHS